ncbi:MAG: alpha/beta hydrolase family protein, partial [Acidobacteria bacterium]|nr:alpha/beta hydrolase family protein [Acidobacteriota bacterium]
MKWPVAQCHGRAGRLGILIAWVVLGAVIASGARSGAAQSSPGDQTEGEQKPRPDPTGFIEREEVRFVTLDLVVEERGGPGGKGWHLARELTKDQIRVFVGGREMALDLFENWCAGAPPGQSPGTIAPATSAGGSSVTTEPAGAVTEESSTVSSPPGSSGNQAAVPPALPSQKYILYFDLQHLTLGGRNRAFRSAMDWAGKTAKPGDEVMILTGGFSLRVVRPLLPVTGSLQADIQRAMEDFTDDDLWAEGKGKRQDEIKKMSRWNFNAAETLAKG